MLLAEAHPAAPLFCHAVEHGIPIALPRGMDKEERDATICCGPHASAIKEAEFIHAELAEHVQAGYVAVFPFGSGHRPPKPVDLSRSGHPSGGKEAAPHFLLYMEWDKRHSRTFSPHGGNKIQGCTPAHPQ